VPLLGIKPDLNPLVANMQGIAKLDCVTVWLTCKNKKMMVSLSLTPERDGGVYTREDPPTTTVCVMRDGVAVIDEVIDVGVLVGHACHATEDIMEDIIEDDIDIDIDIDIEDIIEDIIGFAIWDDMGGAAT
jgi:hypothetical protein